MIAYFDTSAVVKLLIDEPGSDTVERVWHAADSRVCAVVGLPEATAALGRAERSGRLSRAKARAAVVSLSSLWQSVDRMLVDDRLASDAADLALSHALRGFDAIHLAAAVAAGGTLVAADQHLLTAAQATGLAVANVGA